MKFGDKLREARKNKGLTQLELSKLAGVSIRTIINYETGERYPKKRELYYTLAEILDVDVNYLLTEEDDIITDAYEKGGLKGMREMRMLVDGICGMFAGGSMPESDLDAAMQAISEAYFAVKTENKKYTPKKYLK